jgi:hypothetical protein
MFHIHLTFDSAMHWRLATVREGAYCRFQYVGVIPFYLMYQCSLPCNNKIQLFLEISGDEEGVYAAE